MQGINPLILYYYEKNSRHSFLSEIQAQNCPFFIIYREQHKDQYVAYLFMRSDVVFHHFSKGEVNLWIEGVIAAIWESEIRLIGQMILVAAT